MPLPWCHGWWNPMGKTTHKGRKNSKLPDLIRQEGGGEHIWNIGEQVQGTTEYFKDRLKVVTDIVFTCVMLHNMLRTHEGMQGRQGTNTSNDAAAVQNKQVVYVPNDNSGILWGRPNIGKNYWKTTSIMWGHWLGRRIWSEMCQPNTVGGEETGIYQFFSGLPNYSKDFCLSWCCSNFQHISKENPIHFQQVSEVFQTKSQVPCWKTSTKVM